MKLKNVKFIKLDLNIGRKHWFIALIKGFWWSSTDMIKIITGLNIRKGPIHAKIPKIIHGNINAQIRWGIIDSWNISVS